MIVRLKDLRLDSWPTIASDLKKGLYPADKYLLVALRRHETSIPAEVQAYIADLIEGKIDRRGRPQQKPLQIWLDARFLVCRVNRWERVYRERTKAPNCKGLAYAKVAVERGWKSGDITKRKFSTAKKQFRPSELFHLACNRWK